MKKLLFIIVAIMFLLALSSIGISQPSAPFTPTQAPIDGGLGLLVAAGGAYAIKKLRDRNNREIE